eukprot:CAMPEP_0183364622 /NCGR_PEP_ID=MMETSP0164_2-20130417/81059_1 /TAXON_ID=221442 /ORGANISM="Coccolithus pelagicus ssp braarudi, Strain PLY182g" /LENGTH=31 /DNA_ID= /DNA_START= /DNA_END= /DNA_ORIENTATION=
MSVPATLLETGLVVLAAVHAGTEGGLTGQGQ